MVIACCNPDYVDATTKTERACCDHDLEFFRLVLVVSNYYELVVSQSQTCPIL